MIIPFASPTFYITSEAIMGHIIWFGFRTTQDGERILHIFCFLSLLCRRYSPLHGLSSRYWGGLWPRHFLPFGKKSFLSCLRSFLCSVVTSVAVSKNLRNLKKQKKSNNLQKSEEKKSKNSKITQQNSKEFFKKSLKKKFTQKKSKKSENLKTLKNLNKKPIL